MAEPPANRLPKWLPVVLALVLLLAVVAGFAWDNTAVIIGYLGDARDWITGHPVTGGMLFGTVFVLVSAFGILPASVLALAAGFLFGFGSGVLIAVTSVFLGAGLGFSVARYFFGPLMRTHAERHVALDRLDAELVQRGWQLVALVRLSPFFPFAAISYAFGLSTIPLRSFVAGTVGSVPILLLLVWTGATGNELATIRADLLSGNTPAGLFIRIGGVLVTLLIVVIIGRLAHRSVAGLLRTDDGNDQGTADQ